MSSTAPVVDPRREVNVAWAMRGRPSVLDLQGVGIAMCIPAAPSRIDPQWPTLAPECPWLARLLRAPDCPSAPDVTKSLAHAVATVSRHALHIHQGCPQRGVSARLMHSIFRRAPRSAFLSTTGSISGGDLSTRGLHGAEGGAASDEFEPVSLPARPSCQCGVLDPACRTSTRVRAPRGLLRLLRLSIALPAFGKVHRRRRRPFLSSGLRAGLCFVRAVFLHMEG
jgi:hypothetical protein